MPTGAAISITKIEKATAPYDGPKKHPPEHHVALAVFHEGGKPYAELIVDGRTDAYEIVQGAVVNASDVWIGSRPGGFAYTGLIDEIVIFYRRLNAVQVDELY